MQRFQFSVQLYTLDEPYSSHHRNFIVWVSCEKANICDARLKPSISYHVKMIHIRNPSLICEGTIKYEHKHFGSNEIRRGLRFSFLLRPQCWHSVPTFWWIRRGIRFIKCLETRKTSRNFVFYHDIIGCSSRAPGLLYGVSQTLI